MTTTQHQAPEVTSDDIALAEEIVSAANIVSHDGYYEVDIHHAAVTIAAHRTRATQPLSLTVETKASLPSAAFDVLDWLRDNREAIIDRLQSLSGSNCFQNGNSSPVGDGVTKAATDLVAKLDECDPHLTSMFSFALAHDHLYSGPQYGEALEALRAALGEQIAENANCSGDIDRSGLAQEVD